MSERARGIRPESARRWSLPAVEGPVVGATAEANWQKEHSRGYAAGLAAGQAEIQRQVQEVAQRVQRLESILRLLARPLETLDAEVERELTGLALAVGKQLARRELRTEPAQVIAIIRESVARLPLNARDVRVHLHPEDAAVIRTCLASTTGAPAAAWTIFEDPTLARGGCLVRSEYSQIDARFESRVSSIIAALFGEERAGDREAREHGP